MAAGEPSVAFRAKDGSVFRVPLAAARAFSAGPVRSALDFDPAALSAEPEFELRHAGGAVARKLAGFITHGLADIGAELLAAMCSSSAGETLELFREADFLDCPALADASARALFESALQGDAAAQRALLEPDVAAALSPQQVALVADMARAAQPDVGSAAAATEIAVQMVATMRCMELDAAVQRRRLLEQFEGRTRFLHKLHPPVDDLQRTWRPHGRSLDVREHPFFRFPVGCRESILALDLGHGSIEVRTVQVDGRFPDPLAEEKDMPAEPISLLFIASSCESDRDLEPVRELRRIAAGAGVAHWYHEDRGGRHRFDELDDHILQMDSVGVLGVAFPAPEPRAFVPWLLRTAPGCSADLLTTYISQAPFLSVCGAGMDPEQACAAADALEGERLHRYGQEADTVRLGRRVWDRVGYDATPDQWATTWDTMNGWIKEEEEELAEGMWI